MIKIDHCNLDSLAPPEKDKGRFVTIFTDGSYHHESSAWGVGVWIRYSDNPPITLSEGGLDGRSSSWVEEHGVNSAIRYLLENYDITDMIIVIQCDNVGALHKSVKRNMKSLKNAGAKFVKAKHVKGHTNFRTKRSGVNAIVDSLARAEMEKHR